jgi:hypothetical protein
MALPTAQLGQLGNMSMPYSIPTYEKGPGVLEKALAAFLVNAAGGVAGQAAENVMSRDYASEFGQDPAKGFGRLLGPKVSARDAENRREMSFRTGEREATQTYNADQAELDRLSRQGENDVKTANERLARGDMIQAEGDQRLLADMNALLRGDRDNAAATERNNADNTAAAARQQAEWDARRNMPSEQVNQVIIDRMRGQGGQGGQPTSSGNPNIAAFADRTTAPEQSVSAPAYDMPASPDFIIGRDDIAKMLSEGRTPEEIMQIVQRQQAVSRRAQSMPLEPQAPAAVADPRVDALLRQLGLLGSTMNELPSGTSQDVRLLR